MKRLLVAVDFSPVTDHALRVAADLSAGLGATLVVLHVADPDPEFMGYEAGPTSVAEGVARTRVREANELHDRVETLRARGIDAEALSRQGPIAETILESGADLDADLIIVGSHGHRGAYHALIGSVTRTVVNRSRIPVVVVREPAKAD